jgi:hypothetical protein
MGAQPVRVHNFAIFGIFTQGTLQLGIGTAKACMRFQKVVAAQECFHLLDRITVNLFNGNVRNLRSVFLAFRLQMFCQCYHFCTPELSIPNDLFIENDYHYHIKTIGRNPKNTHNFDRMGILG